MRVLNGLCSDESEYQTTTYARSIVKHLLQHIELDPEEHYQEWVIAANALLDNVSYISTFSSDVLAYLYRHKGRACRLVEDYQSALVYFKNALTLLPNYAMIYIGQGLVYRFIGRYEEALSEFGRAIALDENDTWAFAQREESYR